MLAQVPIFPESASTVSDRVDALYLFLVAIWTFFTIMICILIVTFGVLYRRGSKAKRTKVRQSYAMEALWASGMLVLVMIIFAWGAVIFFDIRTPPENAIKIDVVGKQWMWKIQHPNGRSEINELHIPVGRPVQLRTISEDVIHSFFVPAFRVKQDVLPGYYGTLWFEATRTGRFHLFCAEYCGTEHSLMRGTIVVMEQSDYAAWLQRESRTSNVLAGQRLFERFRCDNCHKPDGQGTGPSLVNVNGSTVPLANGRTIMADRQYLRDSIRAPSRHIVAGYRPVMPAYGSDQISESQIIQIIDYMNAMGTTDMTPDRGFDESLDIESQADSTNKPIENPPLDETNGSANKANDRID